MMKNEICFIDTEFHEFEYEIEGRKVPTIELISIALKRLSDGKTYYAVCKDFNVEKAFENDWLRENVIQALVKDLCRTTGHEKIFSEHWNATQAQSVCSCMINLYGKKSGLIVQEIQEFVGEEPIFWGYFADYDWGVFAWQFGRMIDLPKGFPMYCRDLKQKLDTIAENEELPLETIMAHPSYPQVTENEHHALADVEWNLKLFDFLRFEYWKKC